MKIKMFIAAAIFAAFSLTSCDKGAEMPKPTSQLPTEDQAVLDSMSYMLGTQIGDFMTDFQAEFNTEIFMNGLKDAMEGKEDSLRMVPLNQENQRRIFMAFEEMRTAKVTESNAKEAEDFLAENSKKDGIQTTASGLQYEVINEGQGESPAASDTVEVHYEGTFIDGTIFDSSFQRGEPISFPLDGVIPGWTEGVQLMKPGAKYKFYIKPELAYGVQGKRNPMTGEMVMEPNKFLIFDIELISVKKNESPEAPAPEAMN
jgi:FKBP-type peptidyl-prolyl cis-trans isomerase